MTLFKVMDYPLQEEVDSALSVDASLLAVDSVMKAEVSPAPDLEDTSQALKGPIKKPVSSASVLSDLLSVVDNPTKEEIDPDLDLGDPFCAVDNFIKNADPDQDLDDSQQTMDNTPTDSYPQPDRAAVQEKLMTSVDSFKEDVDEGTNRPLRKRRSCRSGEDIRQSPKKKYPPPTDPAERLNISRNRVQAVVNTGGGQRRECRVCIEKLQM